MSLQIKLSRAIFLGAERASWWLLLLLIAALPFHSLNAQTREGETRILYIHSADSSVGWARANSIGFRSHFYDLKIPVAIDELEMSVTGGLRPIPLEADIEIIAERLRSERYDLIVTLGNSALDIFRSERVPRPPDTPLVFAGYITSCAPQPQLPNATGITLAGAAPDNIALGIKFWPATEKIAVLTNDTPEGLVQHRHLQAIAANFPGVEIALINGREYDTAAMMQVLATLPKNSFIVLSGWGSDKDETHPPFMEVYARIAALSPPIMLATDTVLERNVIGGIFYPGRPHGRAAGALAERILAGERADDIPVSVATSRGIFDHDVMVKFGLPLRKLPPKSLLMNQPLPILEYHWSAIVVSLSLLITLILAVWLHLLRKVRSNRLVSTVLGHTPVRIVVVDDQERVLYHQAPDISSRYDLSGIKNVTDLPGFLDKETYNEAIGTAFRTGELQTHEFFSFGRRRRAQMVRLPRELFGCESVLCVSIDIHDAYTAQLATEALSEQFESTLQSIGDGVIVTDANRVITLVNPVASEMIGLPPKRLTGRALDDLVHLAGYLDEKPILAPVEAVFKTGEAVDFPQNVDLISTDGTRRHISANAAPIRDRAGEIIGAVMIFRDVTKEYTTRERIERQKKLMETAASTASSAYFCCSCDAERKLLDFYSYSWSAEEVVGSATEDKLIVNEDRLNYKECWQKIISGESEVEKIVYRVNGDGEKTNYHEILLRRVWNDSKRQYEVFGFVRDVSWMMELEYINKDMNQIFRELVDNLYARETSQFRLTFCNQAYADLRQRSIAELLEKGDDELFPPDEVKQNYLAHDEAVMADGANHITTAPFKDAQGNSRLGYFFRKVITRANGDKLLLGYVMDITQEAKHKREIQQKNLLLSSIMSNLPCELFVKEVDRDLRYLLVNRAFAERFNMAPETLIGKTDEEVVAEDPNARTMCRSSDLQVISTGDAIRFIEEFKSGDESTYMRTSKSLITNPDGKWLLLGISLDITEDIRRDAKLQNLLAELKLHAKQELLLNTCLESVILMRGQDEAVNFVLRTIGEYWGGSLCHIVSYDCENNSQQIKYSWIAPGKRSNVSEDIFVSRPLLPDEEWFRTIRRGEILATEDALAPDSPLYECYWTTILRRMNIRSLYATGISLNDELVGHLGVFYTNDIHSFSDADMRLLQAMAHVIEIVIARGQSREQLERGEHEKRLIMDSIHIPIMLFDPEMNLVSANNAATEIAGRTESEILGKPCWESFCGEHARSGDCPVLLTRMDLAAHNKELKIAGRDYMITAYPIMVNGKLKNILKTLIDVTEFNETWQQLTAAMTEAQNANKAKSQFLATMSHELRTPLNAIIGFAELLQGDIPQEKQRHYLNSIHMAGNALLCLINNVLDFSKIEAEQMQLVPAPLDMYAMAHELNALFRHAAEKKLLEFRIKISPNIPRLMLDALRVRQILLNLIGNAIKFTEVGYVHVNMDYAPKDAAHGRLTIAIRDSGVGVRDDAKQTIFDPFVQQDSIRDSEKNGSGLGLAIALRLTERMGGTLELESRLDVGSTFTFCIDKVVVAETPDSHDTPAPPPPLPASGLKVLVVDDVPMNRNVLAAMLKTFGISAVTAGSGQEALELLTRETPDIVLTDMWMPGMDGAQLAAEIRAIPRFAELPVAAITADSENANNFPMEVFNGVLLKPVTRDKLQTLLADVKVNNKECGT